MVRDTQIDCALAELYHRGKNTERSVAAVQQAEALQSVFMRLNEMEDHLTLVQQVGGSGGWMEALSILKEGRREDVGRAADGCPLRCAVVRCRAPPSMWSCARTSTPCATTTSTTSGKWR